MGNNKVTLTNNFHMGITMALWLASDGYDHDQAGQRDIFGDIVDGPVVSATTLLKPTKSLILAGRIPSKDRLADISSFGSSRIGQAIHDSIEKAFYSPSAKAILTGLGFSPNVIANIALNPTMEEIENDPKMIPVHLEQRAFRPMVTRSGNKVWISGKFDQVIAGKSEDNKSTKAYSYCNMDQSEKSNYGVQQSIYRWLNPKLITSELGQINFIITDWKQGDVDRIKNYPSRQVMEMPVSLMSLLDTEQFILNKLEEIEKCGAQKDQNLMPRCRDDELWRDNDKYKYYSDATKAALGGRSTKNFDTYQEAQNHKAIKGKGAIVTAPGKVKRCSYCDAAPACTQRLEYQ